MKVMVTFVALLLADITYASHFTCNLPSLEDGPTGKCIERIDNPVKGGPTDVKGSARRYCREVRAVLPYPLSLVIS
ncbi:hypothetical protein E6O75_ATG07221 [Venturia nashicola]|uniref:Secreted protein n=1 Tax=Venturia nashicola TaxID=86259 RepID=A0A4Z1NF79_9PEZI|nr:hypothetical protein E6O75_ATG07221 [Venturia nashicola]